MSASFLPLLVILITSSAGCPTRADKTEHFVYSRDSRTGLCFASSYPGDYYSFTHVPCTPWVKSMISCAKNFGEQADRCQGPATIEDAPPADAGE